MVLPFTSQQCFFSTLCVFIVMGFLRGWRRELISLVFVLLAVLLIRPNTSDAVNSFLGRSESLIAYLGGSSQLPTSSSSATISPPAISFLSGPFWSLVIFVFLVALGYCIGNRVFPEPTCAQDRFLGIILAIVSGTFVLFYFSSYVKTTGGQTNLQVNVQQTDPGAFVPAIFVIGIIVLVIALIAAGIKKAPGKK